MIKRRERSNLLAVQLLGHLLLPRRSLHLIGESVSVFLVRVAVVLVRVQGYLAHEKTPRPMALQEAHAEGLMGGVLGGWAFSCERCTPVAVFLMRVALFLVRLSVVLVRVSVVLVRVSVFQVRVSDGLVWDERASGCQTGVQGCLAHKKTRSLRSLKQDHALGLMVVLGEGAFSYGRGTPVDSVLTTRALAEA